ncbi:MAG: DUF1015 domain-containing protein [Moorellales bacterium]
MARIRPFRALRYNLARIPDLASVISPPYDVISTEQQKYYYQAHPNNVIRLELGEALPDDGPDYNRYTRARAYLEGWLKDGILIQEARPGFYLCQDEFRWGGTVYRRTGLVVALAAVPYAEGGVLPHEDTLPRAKSDRFQLVVSCRANFSPIFGLYKDSSGEIAARLRPYLDREPLAEATTLEKVTHRIWPVDGDEDVEYLCRQFAGRTVYIADGHHRYETACRVAEELGEKYGYVLATLVEMEDPGLVVLPTHRLLRDLGVVRWEALPPGFERQTYIYTQLLESPDPLEDFLKILADRGRQRGPSFGFYAGQDRVELVTPAENRYSEVQPDVAVLHDLVLRPVFGLTPERITDGRYVAYTRDPGEAWREVRSGRYQIAVLLNPPSLKQIAAVADLGGRMPQKSTYFWPKLPAGLVMLTLEGIDE